MCKVIALESDTCLRSLYLLYKHLGGEGGLYVFPELCMAALTPAGPSCVWDGPGQFTVVARDCEAGTWPRERQLSTQPQAHSLPRPTSLVHWCSVSTVVKMSELLLEEGLSLSEAHRRVNCHRNTARRDAEEVSPAPGPSCTRESRHTTLSSVRDHTNRK